MIAIERVRSSHVDAGSTTPTYRQNAAIDDERRYLTHRASDELRATLRAAGIEAEIAHNMLTRAYLLRCRGFSDARTTTCLACRFEHVCDFAIDGSPIVHGGGTWISSPERVIVGHPAGRDAVAVWETDRITPLASQQN